MSQTHGYSGSWASGEYQAEQKKITVDNSTFVNYITLSIVGNVTGCTVWFSEHTAQFSIEVQLPLLRPSPVRREV